MTVEEGSPTSDRGRTPVRSIQKGGQAMDFRFTEEEEAFRLEVREFLKKEWTLGSVSIEDPEVFAEARRFEKKMADRGWRTMHWPKEYGGQGASHMMQIILREGMSFGGARLPHGA